MFFLVYDPKFKQVGHRNEAKWSFSSIRTTNEVSISEYLFWLIRVKFEPGTESPDQVNAEIGSEEEPYLVGEVLA